MDHDLLKSLINEALKETEMLVDDIKYLQKGNYYFLEITLDKIGGIDLDGIVKATEIINPIVDKNVNVKESYILDVSSKERG